MVTKNNFWKSQRKILQMFNKAMLYEQCSYFDSLGVRLIRVDRKATLLDHQPISFTLSWIKQLHT